MTMRPVGCLVFLSYLVSVTAVDIFFPNTTDPCIRMTANINVSVVATFNPGPQVKQFPLEDFTVLDNSKCGDDGVTAILNIQTPENVTLLFLFVTEQNRAVQMNSHLSFVPAILFPSDTSDNETVLLNEQMPKALPPPDRAYSCDTDDPFLMKKSTRNNVEYAGVIDLIRFQVQAFNLNGSQYGPIEDCTPASIPTAIPATPPPGKPPINLLFLESIEGYKCIVIKSGIELTIPYTQIGGKKSTKVIGVPDSAKVISGGCSDFGSSSQIAIGFYGNWILSLVFIRNNNAKGELTADQTYSLYSITLTYSISKVLFPDAADINLNTTVSVPLDPPQLLTDMGYSYHCDERKTYTISNGVDISFLGLEYKAFNTDNTTDFDPNKVNKCTVPSPTYNNGGSGLGAGVIVVIVLIVLAVVGAAVGYLYIRQRRTTYSQVP